MNNELSPEEKEEIKNMSEINNKELKMLVEIPKGSINKYEYNKETQQ